MQKTLIYIDTNTRSQIFADGSFVNQSKDYLNIERGQWQILCIQFVDRKVDYIGAVTVSEVSFPANTSFILVADNNFEDDDNLMLKSLQSVTEFDEADPLSNMFNIDGDWIDGTTADFSKGQLSIRINSDTVKYADVLGESEKLSSGVYLSVKQYMQGISNPSTIAWIPFIAINTIRDWSSAQVNPPTGTEAISFINAYFRNPLERQWSDNGEDWFDSQSIEHDEYYRERISNIGAEWSDKIKVARGGTFTPSVDSSGVLSWTNDIGLENPDPVTIKGDKGDKGDTGSVGPANTLTIGTVTTGEPGTQAVASITGEAPNQVLNLTIPKGDKGDPGTGSGSGDMLKSVYDTNNDGKVDAADEADNALNIGGKTATQVAAAVDNSHTHSNKNTLNKLGESSGKLTFDGAEVGGGTADSVAWENVTGTPSTCPPADHTHKISDVNGLQSALDAKGTVKSVNGVQPDAGGNVTIETGSSIDESRLLPENPGDGDVPMFDATATVGGGNDESTKFLLQPIAGDKEIVDTAAGNPAPVAITNNGVSVADDGGMLFTGSAPCGLIIPAYTLPAGVFDGSTDFVIDISYTADSTATGRQCIFGNGEPPGRFDFLLDTDGYLSNGSGPSLGSGWPFGVQVLLTVEIYKENDAWKYTCFRDGAVVASGNWNNDPAWREVDQPIGFDGSYRHFKGTIHAFRITTGTTHRGQAFTPDPLPWTVLQVVGEWRTGNLPSKIDEKITAHNQNSSAHPDKTGYPNYSAGVTITSAFNTADPYTYTFTQNGWLYARCRPGGTFTINRTGTILVSDSEGPYLCVFVPVFTGDVLTGTAAAASLIFYPNR